MCNKLSMNNNNAATKLRIFEKSSQKLLKQANKKSKTKDYRSSLDHSFVFHADKPKQYSKM